MNRLFHADDCAGFGSIPGIIGSHKAVRPHRDSGPVGPHELLAEVSIDQPVAVHSISVIYWRIPDDSRRAGQSLLVTVGKLPFNVGLKERICRVGNVSDKNI